MSISSQHLEDMASRHVRWAMDMQRRPELDAKNSPYASVNNPRWFQGGEPTPDRSDFHDQLMRDLVANAPNVGQDKHAVVLAGPPGAGKSRIMQDSDYYANIPGYDPDTFISIDADYFKERILTRASSDGSLHRDLKPDFVKDLEESGEVFGPLEFASLVHEESSTLAKRAREFCVDQGYNIVVDTVLSSASSAEAIGDLLQRNGYSVSVVDVEIPADVSKEAVAHRWQTGYMGMLKGDPDQALGGRWVPSEYVDGVFGNGQSQPRANAEKLATEYSNVKTYQVYERQSAVANPEMVDAKQRKVIGAPLESAKHDSVATGKDATLGLDPQTQAALELIRKSRSPKTTNQQGTPADPSRRDFSSQSLRNDRSQGHER
ncbi:zeta toxin family protein [Brevibacterium sp. FME37]|uniref:zeta toxin family protein n=1 Tax=Brevibacterium sp. FME37 TaxID=2742607 RepID=UPI0018685328|nr:zeta toxin family protein [Brevibacterium sp. FME37]